MKNIRVGDTMSLLCLFKAPSKDTIVQWLKNDALITALNHNETVQGDELLSNLTIINITSEDQAKYTCNCFYNRSIVTSAATITSKNMSILIKFTDGM